MRLILTPLRQHVRLQGRYVRDHSRLDVTPTGRWLLNMSLENLLRAKYIGPPGPQD